MQFRCAGGSGAIIHGGRWLPLGSQPMQSPFSGNDAKAFCGSASPVARLLGATALQRAVCIRCIWAHFPLISPGRMFADRFILQAL